MAHVGIIGTGNTGRAIAGIVAAGGSTVEAIGHVGTDKPVTGDIVVLAVPYPAVTEVLAERGDELAGLLDIQNGYLFPTA